MLYEWYKNEIKAFKWYLKSGENGNAAAQYYIGKCYHNNIEIKINIAKAIYSYEKAFVNGIKEAKDNQNCNDIYMKWYEWICSNYIIISIIYIGKENQSPRKFIQIY